MFLLICYPTCFVGKILSTHAWERELSRGGGLSRSNAICKTPVPLLSPKCDVVFKSPLDQNSIVINPKFNGSFKNNNTFERIRRR